MSNFLFDASVVIAAYCDNDNRKSIDELQEAIQREGGTVWLYMGEFSFILESLLQINQDYSSGNQNKKTSLDEYLKNYQRLASLGVDYGLPLELDPLATALETAADRLGKDTVVVSVDQVRINRGLPFVDCNMAKKKLRKAQVDFIDLKKQQDRIRPELEKSLHKVLHHGQYVMGPEVEKLEKRLAEFVGVENAVCVSNGTDALLIALMAIGIKSGDEVITTPFTFGATSEVILLLGARPVYVDIDPATFNMNVSMIEEVITENTRAILPISIYGQCADMDAIYEIAARYNLYVVEDAAQSFGATYKGRRSCSLSDMACTSFYPAKPLGAYGDAGACFTQNPTIASKMRKIRDHGQDKRYHHVCLGINGRMDSLQAAVLLSKLEVFDHELDERNQAADRYTNLINEAKVGDKVMVPHLESHNTSSWAQYTVRVNERNCVQTKMAENEAPTMVHYPLTLYKQPAFFQNGKEYPNSEKATQMVLSLPMHPYLTLRDQRLIVNSLAAAVSD